MAMVINGVTLPETENSIYFNGVAITELYFNGVRAWTKKAAAGYQTFTASGTFTVPQGYYEVDVCMCAGGGSGSNSDNALKVAGGGYRGGIVKQTVAVTPGQQISVVIGAGGASVDASNGLAGGATKFGSVTAAGGSGGIKESASYAGDYGTYVSVCNGVTYRDGTKDGPNAAGYGGQAGLYGNGGNGGGQVSVAATAGGYGAGGGGQSSVYNNSGSGGNGRCVVSWG